MVAELSDMCQFLVHNSRLDDRPNSGVNRSTSAGFLFSQWYPYKGIYAIFSLLAMQLEPVHFSRILQQQTERDF